MGRFLKDGLDPPGPDGYQPALSQKTAGGALTSYPQAASLQAWRRADNAQAGSLHNGASADEEVAMRGRTWCAGALAGLTLWVTTTQQAPAQAGAVPANRKVVAVVNGDAISEEALNAILEQNGPVPLQMPEATQRQVRMQALGQLIDTLLMDQFLRQNSPAPPQTEIDKAVAGIVEQQKANNHTLADMLRETHQTEADLRQGIERLYRWTNYANSHIDDAQVQKYYVENKDYFDKVMVRVSHIALRLPYQASADEVAKARANLEGLKAEILAGKIDFASAARAHSQCPSAPQGGDLDFIARKWVVEESFARAAFALKVGEMSDIIRTDFGLHLIKVTDRKPATPSDFKTIKDDVKVICVEEYRQNLLTRLRQSANINVMGP
jgi:parvulin-like peptidyl-prolyl isomerase